MAAKVSVFVDGFNVFYAAREANAKWLNLVQLAEAQLSSGEVLTELLCFTAMVDGSGDPARPHW